MVAFSDTNLHPFWTDAFRNELTDTVFYGAANRGNLWPLAFFLIYMFSGIMGNTASFAFNEANVLSGGASTSIFGLFGALFILGFHFKHNPAIQQLVRHFLLFIVLTFVFGLLDTSVDVWGHVGGLIGGLVLGNVLGLPKQQTSYSIHQRILSTLVFVFLFVICILLGLKIWFTCII